MASSYDSMIYKIWLNRYTYRKWDADWISGTASMLLEVWDWLSSLGLSQVWSRSGAVAMRVAAGARLFPA